MKICTITCHDVYNHGASLQAYALMTYLKSIGNEVEIIDYKPQYLNGHYKLFTIDNPKWKKNIVTKAIYLLLKVPYRVPGFKRKRAFDKFRERNLTITNKIYTSNDELKKDLPIADAFICGSDQIWNSLHKNGRDLSFYLDFVPDNKIKASYGASFATETIDDEYKEMVRNSVSKLDGVAIRERSGVNIVKELGIDKAINVVDPVFLLDKKQWEEVGKEKFDEDYILVYDFDKNPLIEKLAKDIAEERGYKIYTISNYKSEYEDKSFRYSGPNTFVSLVRNSKFVISNSFHAVVFSLIYEKKIAIINRTEAINTRMRDLLYDLGLDDRLIKDNKYDINTLLSKIDYVEIGKKLNEKIVFSKKYLEKVLSNRQL